jgi:large subunit ribosomal protein L17
MRHRIAGKHLGRNHNERQSLLKSQLHSLFLHGFIKTTETKVQFLLPELHKYLRVLTTKTEIESQRLLNILFNDRGLTSRVYKSFIETFPKMTVGFTKVEPIKYRIGDNALMVKLSFVKPFAPKSEVVKVKSKKL